METLKLLVRADGSAQTGMGHVMRCLTLARRLQENIPLEARFATREGTEAVAWIRRHGFPVEIVPVEAKGPGEIAWMGETLRARRTDLVITDLREFVPGILEAIREEGPLCITIDEWGEKRIPSDLLTNGTIVPAWHHYQLKGDVRCLIGAEYALLERPFEQAHEALRPAGHPAPRLLIALGGDDPFFLTQKTLRILEQVRHPLEVTVVIGPAFTDGTDIRAAAGRSRHPVKVLENTPHMAELMAGSDLAVTAGGLIALELACAGTPGFIFCEVDHQLDTAAVLEQEGAAVGWGLGDRVDESLAARDVAELIEDEGRKQRMSRDGRRLLDGKGCARVTRAILDLLEEKLGVCATA